MRRPLVQNRKEENGRSPFSEWRFPLVRPCRVSKSKWAGRPAGLFVSQSVSGSVSQFVQAFSSIAPDRRSRSGRDRHQKMRQRSGTTMVLVTWPKWAGRPAGLFVCPSVSQSVSVCVQGLSSIAPDRRSRSGRLRSQKMRQSVGTTMTFVTWRHVSRVTRHVPPREPFEKFSNTAAAQTGGRRESKLSGQKGLGLT